MRGTDDGREGGDRVSAGEGGRGNTGLPLAPPRTHPPAVSGAGGAGGVAGGGGRPELACRDGGGVSEGSATGYSAPRRGGSVPAPTSQHGRAPPPPPRLHKRRSARDTTRVERPVDGGDKKTQAGRAREAHRHRSRDPPFPPPTQPPLPPSPAPPYPVPPPAAAVTWTTSPNRRAAPSLPRFPPA